MKGRPKHPAFTQLSTPLFRGELKSSADNVREKTKRNEDHAGEQEQESARFSELATKLAGLNKPAPSNWSDLENAVKHAKDSLKKSVNSSNVASFSQAITECEVHHQAHIGKYRFPGREKSRTATIAKWKDELAQYNHQLALAIVKVTPVKPTPPAKRQTPAKLAPVKIDTSTPILRSDDDDVDLEAQALVTAALAAGSKVSPELKQKMQRKIDEAGEKNNVHSLDDIEERGNRIQHEFARHPESSCCSCWGFFKKKPKKDTSLELKPNYKKLSSGPK